MSTAMAKTPKRPSSADGPRKVGRPSTGIESDSFCCRAPLLLISAFTELAKVTRLNKPGTELLRAAEDHIVRMYREIRRDPDSAFIDSQHTQAFFDAAEAYLKEAKRWPLPDDDTE